MQVIVQRLVAQAKCFAAKSGAYTPWSGKEQEGGWLLRLNHYTWALANVRPDVRHYTHIDTATQLFTTPPLADLLAVSVVVTTCGGAAMVRDAGVPREHFSLIVIDEAAQALEPETLIPLALKGPRCRVVLTGDWRQLGPVVRSAAADSLGLSKSLIERVASLPPYKSPNSRCLVALTRNYRSHQELLAVPSKLFYQQSLQACADPAQTGALLGATAELVQDDDATTTAGSDGEEETGQGAGEEEAELAEFPLLFYGVEGRDVREDDSPSFYNPTEAVVITSLVQKLLASQRFRVTSHDIGIIAPYRKQVQKIRLLLRKAGLEAVRVGTVDDYQGQEERVVFISTTLSHTERLNVDSEYSLGFLANPRRFNVALTRAKSLCVVVGNPYVMLAKDHWRTLLQFCIDRRSYAGCSPPLRARGEAEDDDDEWWEADEGALLQLMQERMLGSGAAAEEVGAKLETLYRDEQEFRVIL